jgi:hypothetical protein
MKSFSMLSLNVGGCIFATNKNTLLSETDSFFTSLLSSKFDVEKDPNGHIFIDRDPTLFCHILNWLRSRKSNLPLHFGKLKTVAYMQDTLLFQLTHEATFYGLDGLSAFLSKVRPLSTLDDIITYHVESVPWREGKSNNETIVQKINDGISAGWKPLGNVTSVQSTIDKTKLWDVQTIVKTNRELT